MRFLPLALSLLSYWIHALAVDNSTILSPKIDAFINNILTEWNSPGGASVAVVRKDGQGGWLVETKGYGVATADGSKVTPDTIFSIGSNSKLFDVLATGLLISNASLSPQISWNTKIASVIPGWKLMDPVASKESTITDLMSHRTGLPRHDFSYFVFNDTVPALVKRLRYLKPSAGFRETWQYNTMMYTVLSYLPTVLLRHKPPYESYVKDNIIEPLGLNSTGYSFAVANATGRLADGFTREGVNTTADPLGAGTTRALPYFFKDDNDSTSTFAAILTTAVDMARWLQMLLLNGQHPTTNATIIPSSVIQTVATGVTVAVGNAQAPELSPVVYGGGQVHLSYRGHDMVEHNGAIPGELNYTSSPEKAAQVDELGFFAWITRFPLDGAGVAVIVNEDLGLYTADIIKYRIIDEIFGLDPVDWNSRYKDQAQQAALSTAVLTSTPAPSNATLPLPLTAMEGKYRDPGYGPDIALCAPSARSSNCKALLKRLNSTFPDQLATADLIWDWDRLIASYVALKHFDGAVFNVSAWVAMPTGNETSPLWAYDSELEGSVAEFVITKGKVSGFGIRGGLWGAEEGVGDPEGRSVEARSEVWFDALGA
ncbi:beta-lactamase/transpeptidase-like protein [Mycena latifolia]|nr:beta-lactamase/transpeptidase-like protein [Mycena latifolia]